MISLIPFFRSAGLLPALCLALATLASGTTATAAEPQLIGSFNDWNAFSYDESGQKVCYMSSRPKKDEGNYKQRGDIYVLITHRPAEKSLDVVSVTTGYTYKEKSETIVSIGNQNFRLFTDGDTAWARDEKTDRALVDAIRSGSAMVIKGTSNRGTATTDTYSLSGTSAAYEAISKACNVKR
ncbi:invasion associated locus B family protein [Skermanella mucosa]|uniref:invasion associated locus B family protein n=1 Tax=Skermanella mucosa TaxID=1789672 RepID=UPI00192C4FB3|nr:invasion associated locus B family protein [Skermanella mucosa]UEM21492.1 invasion associated locus B family protein [Skermanella mucosa]